MPDLYQHLAACDLGIVQGGLTTCMELTANQRPFLYFPLAHHFEQNFHVRHRLDRYRRRSVHGLRRLDARSRSRTRSPRRSAATVDYEPVATDGAARAAAMIAELLTERATGSRRMPPAAPRPAIRAAPASASLQPLRRAAARIGDAIRSADFVIAGILTDPSDRQARRPRRRRGRAARAPRRHRRGPRTATRCRRGLDRGQRVPRPAAVARSPSIERARAEARRRSG